MNAKLRLTWFVLLLISATAYPSVVRSQSIILQNYDQSSVPKNKDGDTYPIYYDGGSGVGGPFSVSIDSTDAISGSSLLVTLNSPSTEIYAQYNPYGYNVGVQREFTHTYAACGYPPACGNPASWQYNTYTKFRFWIKVPTNSTPPSYTGQGNCNVGLYIKNITNADSTVDEGGGGGHFYHMFSVEPTGTWWQVILNMHPTHERGPTAEVGYIPYITADKSRGGQDPANTYNYWDTLSRFYIQCNAPAGNPWKLDQLEFYADPVPEDDIHLASAVSGTYVPSSNKIIVNWERQIAADSTNWEVRYAYSDIHALGWNNATPAPSGVVTPLGGGAYVEMHYVSTNIPTAGRSVIYIAVKSQAEPTKFNQIAIPLSGGAPPTPPPPSPTPLVSISASPSSITSGQSTTLSWSSSNVTSCSASGGWSGTRATSGNLSVSPTTTTTYTLTCTGASGSANQSTIVTVSALPPPPPPAPPPSSGLSTAAYSLDEGSGSVAADSSGNANTLSLFGALWSSGKTRNALLFNGTGFADAVNSSSLNITSNQLTLEAWVNPTTLSGDTHIVSKIVQAGQHNSPYFAYSLHVVSGNVSRFWVTTGGTGHSVQSSVGLTTNTWHHIAGTYDGATMKIYVNGQLAGSTSLTGNISGYNGPLRLAANGAGGEVWNGKIDDVRVYSRALSQAEIQADMNTPVGGGVAIQPPVAPSSLAVQ